MKKPFVFLAIMMLSAVMAMAAPRSKAEMQAAARQAINKQRSNRHLAPSNQPLKTLRSMKQLELIGTEESGYAVIATDDLMPAVMGVSEGRYSQGANENFEWWLAATNEAVEHLVANNMPLQVTTPDPDKFPTQVPSMVTSRWDQDKPYNNLCPAFNSSTNCLTGCVATAMAQVLNYHKKPEHGQGARTIYYPQGAVSTGQPVTANFYEDYYDWENMLDYYVGDNYSQEEANAVALLMRDCGVAANMEYGGPNEGSGTYSEDAADGLREYFGFADAQCLKRDYYPESKWMEIIYEELSENGPLYYAGASWSSGGHAFVFDGYDAEGKVSVNWGWSGQDDGYFFISQLNPSFYDFNIQQDMIVGIKSNNHSLLRTETVTVFLPGQLRSMLESVEAEGMIGTLTVNGPLNGDDLTYIRELAGFDANGESTGKRLRILDLSNARLEGNELPDGIFKNCSNLQRVRLPESLTSIGADAFNGCKGLGELRVTTKIVPTLKGTSVFNGMPFGTAKLYVRSGLKTKFAQAAQWNKFGENNILQFGTTLKVRNEIRNYGEQNPKFTYNIIGDKSIVGEPRIYCEATESSPAGRYPIMISPGNVANSEIYDFIDGYLIIKKIDGVIAQVKDAERCVGEPDPQFEMNYIGLVNGDLTPTWAEEPVFSTSATATSKPGNYIVYVKSATADSYNITFLPGTLKVKPAPVPDGISDLNAADDDQAPAYNLQGQQTTPSKKGLYIRNGKKILK